MKSPKWVKSIVLPVAVISVAAAVAVMVCGPAAATAEALERDPHTIGRWASAFGEGGPAALIFEQTGGSPPPLTRRSRRS